VHHPQLPADPGAELAEVDLGVRARRVLLADRDIARDIRQLGLRGTSRSAVNQPRIVSLYGPNAGDVRSAVLRAGGVADANACRTVRRCTP
jgi:hypothetical protein